MNFDLFKKIVDECQELGISQLDLTPLRGEAFLHENIYEMLSYSLDKMNKVILFTNLTCVNIEKLKKLNLKNLQLHISHYGDNSTEYLRLTGTGENLFLLYQNKLKDLKLSKIPFNLERRDNGAFLDFGEDKLEGKLEGICKFHGAPVINYKGDIFFCKYINSNTSYDKGAHFSNVAESSLKECLEHSMRYNFLNDQSFCKNHCSSFNQPRVMQDTLNSYKLLQKSKSNYESNKQATDSKLREFYRHILKDNHEEGV